MKQKQLFKLPNLPLPKTHYKHKSKQKQLLEH